MCEDMNNIKECDRLDWLINQINGHLETIGEITTPDIISHACHAIIQLKYRSREYLLEDKKD